MSIICVPNKTELNKGFMVIFTVFNTREVSIVSARVKISIFYKEYL